VEKSDRKKYITGMEEAPENDKESLNSAYSNGMNVRNSYNLRIYISFR
jgi:hypothetical protein